MGIVVTGATGRLGRHVIDQLLEQVVPDQVTALARDAAKAADLGARGVRVLLADYNVPATLQGAFSAGDRVLLISGTEDNRLHQHLDVIAAARAAGVGLLAYTSALGTLTADLVQDHRYTENALRQSGVPYTLLRNGWYHENYTERLAPVLEIGAVVSAAGKGRVASASRADYAAAAVAVLTGPGHENTTYELSGDRAWDFAEYAAALSRATGRRITHTPVSPEAYRAGLVEAGMPEQAAETLVALERSTAAGELGLVSGDLSRLTGGPTTPLDHAITAALEQS